MVAKVLVSRDIEGGHELIDRLNGKMRISAAYWLYEPENEIWRLIIATPILDSDGPNEAYGRIQDALQEVPEVLRPSLMDISAVSPRDTTATALRRLIRTGAGVSNSRVTRSVVDGVYIDDALVYLSN